jgi:hypothetical protein
MVIQIFRVPLATTARYSCVWKDIWSLQKAYTERGERINLNNANISICDYTINFKEPSKNIAEEWNSI